MFKNVINILQVTCCISTTKISLLMLLREIICLLLDVCMYIDNLGEQNAEHWYLNLLKPTSYVMHQQFNIQQLYALPALYLCVLYLSENKQ